MTAQSSLAVTPSLASAINPHVIKVFPDTSIAEIIRRMSDVEGEACAMAENDKALGMDDWPPVPLTVVPAADADSPAIEGFVREENHENPVSEKPLNDASAADRPVSKKRASCAIIVAPETQDSSSPHRVIGILTERDIVRLAATQAYNSQDLSTIPVSAVMTTPVKTMEASAFQDIFAVLFLFRRYRIRHLPIVDSANQLVGVVTPASIRQVLRPANLLKMRRVGDVMSKDVVQAPMSASVMFLAQVMAEHRVSCVVIVDASIVGETGVPEPCPPVGIVTERDIVQFQSLGLDLTKVTAETVMSQPLHLLDPQDSLWAAHEAMKTRRVRRLVVSWNWGKGLGIVTQTSLLRVFDPIEMYGIIDSLQHTVKQMKAETGSGGEIGSEAEGETVELLGRKISPRTNLEPSHLAAVNLAPTKLAAVERAPANLEAQKSLVALLTEATDYIAAARQPGLGPSQQRQLTRANQLVQRVRAELIAQHEQP